jgi:hypothetical protein
MSQNLPSDALKQPRRPLLIGAVILGSVVALSGIGAGAFAIGQAVNGTQAPAAEPTPTEEPNVAPTASFSVLDVDGLDISVDGANSIDPDGAIASYEWDFGDGTTASGATVSHTYADYGTYTVTLTVTDGDEATGTFSTDVDLIAPPPPPPPPAPPASAEGCPAGSFVAQGGPGVELLCMWNICTTLTLPDPAHPECDAAFRP